MKLPVLSGREVLATLKRLTIGRSRMKTRIEMETQVERDHAFGVAGLRVYPAFRGARCLAYTACPTKPWRSRECPRHLLGSCYR